MAKLTLIPRDKQEGRSVSSFMFRGIKLIAGETKQVDAAMGVMYMADSNFIVEFEESDFDNMTEKHLNRLAEKLNISVKDVKSTVLPKSVRKSITTKVKEVPKKVSQTVKTTLSKPKIIEEKPPVEEKSPVEEVSND